MRKAPIHVIMLGGGYVSVWAYRSLAKRLRAELADGRVKITVVCPTTHHVFHGWTAESLTGIMQYENQASPLAELMPKAHLVTGTAQAIDAQNQVVYVTRQNGFQQALPYDHLLLGTGAYDSDTIDGIRQYGYQVKSHEGFLKTREAIQQLVQLAAQESPSAAQRLLTFTVAGGGFTGVELAANLAEYVRVAKKQYPSLRDRQPHIRLIHSGSQLLPTLSLQFKRLARYAERQLNDYEIEVLTNTRITRVTEGGAFLNDKTYITHSLLISTVGQKRRVLRGTETMVRDKQQRLYTTPYQQISGFSNLWGGGDACHVPHPETQDACPANALWAIKHGHYVGKNIARAIKEQPLKPFSYKGLGQSASLGLGKGLTELYGFQFTGWLAWLMRWFFFMYFMPSRKTMLRAVGDWLTLFLSGRRRIASHQELRLKPTLHGLLTT